MMLFASSASAGHRFAICAVSNCVSSGSLRKILSRAMSIVSGADDKYEEAYSLTADAESVVLNFAKVFTYSRVLLYTLKEARKRRNEGRRSVININVNENIVWLANDAHGVWCILVPVFEQVLDLRDQKTAGVVKF
jgi:hypothetical protein